ncbi:MAG: low molecular weight protein-tyrosine-phosphatase [Pseudomonadota bacterium]
MTVTKIAPAILFVCLGNICRSPLAEGILRKRWPDQGPSEPPVFDSAGLGSWHEGDPPDARAIRVARESGYDISAQRARQVRPADFHRFDLIFAMDRSTLTRLQDLRPTENSRTGLHLFLEYAENRTADVPDPYYGDETAFRTVVDLIERASDGLITRASNAN